MGEVGTAIAGVIGVIVVGLILWTIAEYVFKLMNK